MGHREALAELRGRLTVPLLTWLLLPFVVAATGTWIARRYALKRQLLDQPGERRSHAVATPRGGGIAIVVAVLLSIACVAAGGTVDRSLLSGIAGGLLLVAGIGWLDDHRPISPWPRLFVHGMASGLLAWGLHRVTGDWVLSLQAFVLAMVLTNVWNFMDGIDGLAASQAVIVAFALALALGGGWMLLAVALGAATLGFLPYNFPKARIFLGDVGSGALGFLLAALASLALLRAVIPWPLLMLPLAAFLVDATFTLAMRILRREKWWSPHVQHTYQRWAAREGSHVKVTLAYAGFSLMGVILAVVGLGLLGSSDAWTSGIWICLFWYLAAAVLWARMRMDVVINKDAQQ